MRRKKERLLRAFSRNTRNFKEASQNTNFYIFPNAGYNNKQPFFTRDKIKVEQNEKEIK
jgi:hypothetical protein